MFQELTRRKLDTVDYKKYQTDTDNVNKSFFLKENGEIEQLKKDEEEETEKVDTSEITAIQQKTNNSKNTSNMMTNIKSSNVIMKGEPKPISQTVLNLTDKNFNIKIVEPKVFEKPIRVLRQNKEQAQSNSQDMNKTAKSIPTKENTTSQQPEEKKIQLNDFIEMAENEQEKFNRIKNPFDWIEEKLSHKLSAEAPDDFKTIYPQNQDIKFTYMYFKNLRLVSVKSVYLVVIEINNLVDTYYNILSEQINEFVNIFDLIFEAYLSASTLEEECEIGGEKNSLSKFKILHDSLIIFFQKCQKNKTEEMSYLFRFTFIEKIFEVMNTQEQEEKLFYFCELIFNLLDPLETQQVMFVRFIKDNIIREELFYDCLGVFHDLLLNYSESFIDGCLFYVLNGLKHENAKIRYNCFYILLKYAQMNVNFYINFEKYIEKLSRYEPDRENNLVLIKIAIAVLYYIEVSRQKGRDGARKTSTAFVDKLEEDSLTTTQFSEVNSPNSIIRNIMIRMIGDKLFIFIASSLISEVLYENFDLYKIFVYCLVKADKGIKEYLIFDNDLDHRIQILLTTKFKTIYNTHKIRSWNYAFIFKAYAHLVQFGLEHGSQLLKLDFNYDSKRKILFLREEDYYFINYCFGESLNPEWAENWKKSFTGFSKYVLQDLFHPEKCERSLKIIEKFLYLESIQKQISEEIYEQLLQIIKDLVMVKNEVCYSLIMKYIDRWLKSTITTSMLRDSLRRLNEIK
eukprot:CAMPEP_0170519776 /NCGR_PEP_ID=MMETSP0209-20121228/5063_1 /TAXON_ID=665100 ORGANISM="Litonotus pictus, Strain P1" /NCGR_SAMPLE_ID=MMETSP0209 /ASSEMBLY_ACC=CAM_ASM_000301 /LENGTH=737 /DNA_ID=CAMNT_0010805739 /DNA_START=423 /DNA_END=2633 /DNA_ORIENTATION=-